LSSLYLARPSGELAAALSFADVLARRAIPFAFTTGFEGSIVIPERFAAFPVFSKPYSEEEVLAVLRRLLMQNHGQETQRL